MSETLKFGNGEWATKKGSTLAYNDENGNFKPLPFSFTRNSSATRVNKEGLIEVVSNNEPRIDFKDSSEGALLLEPSRSNLLTYSEDFSNSGWASLRLSLTSSNNVSPDGTLNASEITLDTTNDSHTLIHSTITGVSAQVNHTISVFVKSNGNDKVALRDATIGDYVSVDLSNGVILDENSISSSVDKFDNNWYRISLTILSSSGGQIRPSLYLLQDSYTSGIPSSAYLGNGVGSVYVWGFQAEQGSYATSYIPTSGQANGVTRVADSDTKQIVTNSVIGQTEGTIFYDINLNNVETSSQYIGTLSDGSSTNRIQFLNNSSKQFQLFISASTISNNININTSIVPSGRYKVAIAYKSGDVALYINGTQEATSSETFTFQNLTYIDLGQRYDDMFFLFNPIKEAKLYNTRLSNSELQALTSI